MLVELEWILLTMIADELSDALKDQSHNNTNGIATGEGRWVSPTFWLLATKGGLPTSIS